MTEFQGVLLRGQLRRLAAQCEVRLRNYTRFCDNIKSLPGIVPCRLHPQGSQHPIYLALFRYSGEQWLHPGNLSAQRHGH